MLTLEKKNLIFYIVHGTQENVEILEEKGEQILYLQVL